MMAEVISPTMCTYPGEAEKKYTTELCWSSLKHDFPLKCIHQSHCILHPRVENTRFQKLVCISDLETKTPVNYHESLEHVWLVMEIIFIPKKYQVDVDINFTKYIGALWSTC